MKVNGFGKRQRHHQVPSVNIFGQRYLLAFELGGQSPVEWTDKPAGVELSGVKQHVAAILVNSRYAPLQVRLTDQ